MRSSGCTCLLLVRRLQVRTPPTLCEIQRIPPKEIEDWYEAMDVELDALRQKNTMTEIDRSDVPIGKQIVKSTWAFRRKRRPNGEVHK